MNADDSRQQELIDWLREKGHTQPEIDKILAKVAEYDAQTLHESIFDSIDQGKFDIASIIKAALGEEEA